MKQIFLLVLALSFFSSCNASNLRDNPGVSIPEGRPLASPSAKAIELNNRANTLFLEEVAAHGKTEKLSEFSILFDQAVQESPDYHLAYSNKAGQLLALKRFPEAADAYSMAIKIKPSVGEYYLGQALALQRAGKVEEAKTSCRYAIAAFNLRLKKDPNDPSRLDRAIAINLLGDKTLALKEVEDFLKHHPHDETAKQLQKSIESNTDFWELLGG